MATMRNGHSTARDVDSEKAQTMQTEQYGVKSDDPVSYQRYPTRIANAGPMGIFAFASTTFLLSMVNVGTRGVHTPNLVLGMALFSGGLVQFMAGMWEFPRGNVFGATAFSSYGAFWFSYATIFIPSSGILSAYSNPQELNNAIGLYLMTWFTITIIFMLAVIRRSVAFTALLAFLAVAFMLLAVGSFTGKSVVTKAGGVFGIITAFIAYYIGLSELLAAEQSAFLRLPLGILSA